MTKPKKAGGMAQVVEYLPHKHEYKTQYCQKYNNNSYYYY
jgi:hypothetical protein